MKQQLNEVQKLQKIAGILKEAINIKDIITKLNAIAKSKGFKL